MAARNTKTSSIPLEVIQIPKPCPADWDAMRGDERVRFCGHCSLHVYNLSAMKRADAERLLAETEGRSCVRLYQRLDGTVITQDCGGGWKLAAKRFRRFASAATALALSAVLAPFGLSRFAGAAPSEKCATPPIVTDGSRAIMGDFAVPAPPPEAIMGKIAPPPPPATQPAVKMGEAIPLMGTPAPLPAPPATQPAK